MPDQPFISLAQNGEDVVLRRALRHVAVGRYVDVGANHPSNDSISRSFYDRGWQGITVEPTPALAAQHREERPRDLMIEAVITRAEGGEVVLHAYEDTGLSTTVDQIQADHAATGRIATDLAVPSRRLDAVLTEAGWQGQDIHFMTIDTEGAEAEVLGSLDLTVWRPWVLVIESTFPNSDVRSHQVWEPGVLAAGYEFCLFDGLSRFYVAAEHAADLRERLDYPACIADNFITWHTAADRARIANLEASGRARIEETIRWRTAALTRWAASVSTTVQNTEIDRLHGHINAVTADRDAQREEIVRIRRTISWRVTAPIRKARVLARSRS